MRHSVFLAAASLMLGATVLRAQSPNLSGTWAMDTTGMGAMMGGGGGGGGGGRGGFGGGPMTITQDTKTVTISRTMGGNEIKMVYNLDGSDSKNTMQRRGGAVEVVSKAKWDDAKLVITSTQDMGGTPATITVTYSLEGAKLVQSTTRPGRDGGDPMTRTIRYNKQ